MSVAQDINDVLSTTASRYSDQQAIVHNGRSLSYAELNSRVCAAARRLGPQPGVVGIPSTHSPETIVGLLGVWAAGGTYCPIDPAFPAERQQALLAAADCHTRFTVRSDATPTASPGPRDTATGDFPALAPEQPAYILFTSGSTGVPKPVVTPRRAITTVVRSLRDLFGITPADRVLQFASLNWDTCFEEILPTLTAGATLVFNDEAYTGSFPRFLRMLEHEQITVLNLPTAFWHELVRYLQDTGTTLPASIRAMVIGGEAVSPARLADWCDLGTAGIRLINTYGCTETTLITHAVDLHGPQAPRFATGWRETGQVPIGWALPHVVERLSDQDELLIGGPALALGYRGLPEATAARFVDLDTPEGPARFFRTGDRARRSPDGMLVPAGRLDHEVKVRGIRVDPGEVESHIAGHPGVNAVAVVGATVAGRTALLAYVVPRPQTPLDSLDADVRAYLRARVPSHLVPSRITVVSELAHTPSGKVDRTATHQHHTARVSA